ncbi:MAG: hypothetical protein JWN24_385 [Phycisphaerales bacterium]|nr:hypothetical protein [Phycisphaerales bacterium]
MAHLEPIESLEGRVFLSVSNPNHVLILSVDGLHQADVADPALASNLTNILALQAQGITYTNAKTTTPSDSFPGTLSYLTGAGPGTTGVFYDVSYDRKLFAPGSNTATAKPGGVVTYDETIDKNTALLSGGGNFDASSIDPSLLPLDSHGHVVYPHSFLKVNTIFNVAHNAGLPTAFTDKHPVYDIANGPSGNGVDDLYTPELNSNVALLNNTTQTTVNADTLLASAPFTDLSAFTLVDANTDPLGASDPNLELTTNNTLLTEKYDDLHVQAILNEIDGLNSKGTAAAAVPALFAGNFQAVSVAQKFTNGGIMTDGMGNEVISAPLQSALQHTDASIGRIEAALKAQNLWKDTLFVVTAKHGQDPRVGSARLFKDDTLNNVLSAANINVGGATGDDGSLIWLTDQKQAAAAVTALTAFQSTGTIDVFNKGVKSTIPASQVIDKILSGKDLVAAGLGNSKLGSNTRTPDLIVTLKPGFILVGNPANFSFKNAEHGGFLPDDTNIALIAAGGKVAPSKFGTVNTDTVHTQQIAVSALDALGLNSRKLRGAVIDHTKALPGLLSATLGLKVAPGYKVSLFGTTPVGASQPDSIAVDGSKVFVGFGNGVAKDGSDGKTSTIVQYNADGSIVNTFTVPGHNDGLKVDPSTHLVWALQNEDGNPNLVIINPVANTQSNFTFAPPANGGGYDDITFLGGNVYLSESAPANNPNTDPAVVQATLSGSTVSVATVLLGNATAVDNNHNSVTLNLQDPDSMTADPSGDLVLTSQADNELVIIKNPAAASQSVTLLPLSDAKKNAVSVDDTLFTASSGDSILLTDQGGRIYQITGKALKSKHLVLSAAQDIGQLGMLNTTAGRFTPVITGLKSPRGLASL